MLQRAQPNPPNSRAGHGLSPAAGRSSPLDAEGSSPSQEPELFLLSAPDSESLRATVRRLKDVASHVSPADLSDLAATLAAVPEPGVVRAAIVADQPLELTRGLERLERWLSEGRACHHSENVFLGLVSRPARIGFLFPGQGSPAYFDGGAFRQRFDCVRSLYELAHLPIAGDRMDTVVAQPAIVTASLVGLGLLRQLGIEGQVAVGHSLGEWTALHWAGAWNEAAILRLVAARGRAMDELGAPSGAMAGIGVDAERVKSILNGEGVVLAGFNSPRQTVVSGQAEEVARVVARAQRKGWPAIGLPVAHAFHSSFVAAVAPKVAQLLSVEPAAPVGRLVASTITGGWLHEPIDLKELLVRQLTSPVRFMDAVRSAEAKGIDLWIEVGPGQILRGLMGDLVETQVVAMDAGGSSLRGLLSTVGAAFVRMPSVRASFLYEAGSRRRSMGQECLFDSPLEIERAE